ncbi:MAG: hypothetical protein HC888_01500 [Candidatus Competibacteraceae bacterium]|nr:hypothetical protein [Candidatus Competibacteraceae bacterium]
MFTQLDKALAALIGAGAFLLQNYAGIELTWLSAETIEGFIPFLTAILVYVVPNKA